MVPQTLHPSSPAPVPLCQILEASVTHQSMLKHYSQLLCNMIMPAYSKRLTVQFPPKPICNSNVAERLFDLMFPSTSQTPANHFTILGRGEEVTEQWSEKTWTGDNVLKTVGGSGGSEEPLSLAVSRPVQRVDVVAAIVPDVAPQRVGPLAQPGHEHHTTVKTRKTRGRWD